MEDLSTDTTTPPAAAAGATRRSFSPAVLAATTVLALAAGFGAGWVAHTSSSASAATTAVHGTLQLPKGGYDAAGDACSGSGGYSDITAGTAVTIGDQTGKTLAVTSLQAGQFNFDGGGCQFTFTAKVPAADSYTVTISHRGTQVFPASAVAGGFNLTMNAG